MNQEKIKTLTLAGILWIIYSFAFVIAGKIMNILGNVVLFGSSLLGDVFIIFSLSLFLAVPGFIMIGWINENIKDWIKKNKIYSIIIGLIALFFVFVGFQDSLNNVLILFLYILFGIYISLWHIPVKYPAVKPLFVSLSIGFIVWTLLPLYIPLIGLILGIKGEFHDALGAALFFGAVYIASFIVVMGISLIIGIVLSIKKKKTLK